jgi:type VI secretion system protein ImpC
MSDAQRSAAAPQTAEQTTEQVSLLDQIVEQGRLARDPASKERGKNLVRDFVAQVLEGAITVSRDAEAMITARIAQIDHLISIQLNEVLHHPSFQKLEGSWRGLKYLMDQSETSSMLKIKVLNVTKRELLRDLQRAPEFDQSALFKKVYEEEYGVFGGAPSRR